uniref:Homeobox domain-containing protein n=1 Tax=Meloidogyne hapla TaxID=6305 RepID=A0A1I8B6K8_MELHA
MFRDKNQQQLSELFRHQRHCSCSSTGPPCPHGNGESQETLAQTLERLTLRHDEGKIKIVDSSPECFKTMLEYFYNGEIDKDTLEKYSEDLFAIAHKYEVKGLMQVCETSMASNIDASNFSQRCHYAELYCLPKLEKLKALKDEFRNGHYPDIYSRKELANKTGLKEDIIQVWFTNKRARYRRKKRMNANN